MCAPFLLTPMVFCHGAHLGCFIAGDQGALLSDILPIGFAKYEPNWLVGLR